MQDGREKTTVECKVVRWKAGYEQQMEIGGQKEKIYWYIFPCQH